MAYDLAQSLQALGVEGELGLEIQRQIASGTPNINTLLTLPMLDVEVLTNGIAAGTVDPDVLAEASIVPEVAALIAKAINQVPVNTVLPVVTGTTEVGETLTVSNGTWTSKPPLTYSYQWLSDGTPIEGETGNTYDLVADDENAEISATVTATNANGSASATSAAVGPVTDPA